MLLKVYVELTVRILSLDFEHGVRDEVDAEDSS